MSMNHPSTAAVPPQSVSASAPVPPQPATPAPATPVPPRPPGAPASAVVPELTGADAYLIDEKVGLHAHSGFESALRGYDRRQVDRYVTRTQRRIDELSAELAVVGRRERDLLGRVEELSSGASSCTCGPGKPESAI